MHDSYILNSKLFFDANTVIQITKTHSSSDDFCRLIVERVRRFEKDVEMYALVAHHCIEELLIEGFEQLESPTQIEHMRKLSDLGVVNTFTVLVNKHYRKNTTVAYYANLMNMTYQKLSEICFNVLGKSAKDVISDIVIKEAIRYIRNTNLSISQISYELGFTDESNFRRFFKKHTGKTALTFRQR